MGDAVTIKGIHKPNQRKILLSGVLVGVYINSLHSVPFMEASEIFFVFVLILISAITMPAVAAAWDQTEFNGRQKIQLILNGVTASSIIFIFIYFIEMLLGNYIFKIFTVPTVFPISRFPSASLVITLIIAGLSIAVKQLLKRKTC